LQYANAGIAFTGAPPIQLELGQNGARNWVALARLDDRRFLLMTNTYPEMILGFVSSGVP
jgi:hypothetical protein